MDFGLIVCYFYCHSRYVFGLSTDSLKYFSSRFNQIALQMATTVPLYSASALENATLSCYLLYHKIALLLSEKMNPDVDHLSAL